jgi:Tfp pilus assembly protein PilF
MLDTASAANAEIVPSDDAAANAAKAASGPQHSAARPETAEALADQDYEPLERIARSYDESSFRQAAFAMEQMNAMKLSAKPPSVQASLLSKRGTDYVHQGLLLEAQRQFQLALAADPRSAAAEAGLAEVHEYSGNAAAAQSEAAKSIEDQPNVAGYLVLARIALSKHLVIQAQQNVNDALAIDPKNTAAKGIQQAIQAQQVAH